MSYLEEKVAAPVCKTENTAVGDASRSPLATLYPRKLTVTSPIRGCRSVGIVRPRTQATEFHNLHSFPDAIRSRSRRMRWAVYVAYMTQDCSQYFDGKIRMKETTMKS
jgi:hypothetical protein